MPKEPHYFCSDFDYYHAPGRRTIDHYLGLYSEATDDHLAIGEASVWYLYSQAAAAEIVRFDPEARVVVMVRNPLEMVPSLHGQLLYAVDEDERDVARAWALQGERAAGRSLPERVRVAEFLQYGEACRLGAQMERLLGVIPREQVLPIVFDDFRADPGAVYRDTLAFLGVPDDGRREFPRINPNTVHRAPAVAKLTQRPPGVALAAARAVKRVTGIKQLGILNRIRARNRVVAERAPLDPAFLDLLADHFRDDVALLGRLLQRDLSHWTDRGVGSPTGGTLAADN